MYKITWDKETGGVLLHSRIVDGTLGVSPRPVFFEELDLLKLDELGWKYPRCQEPLLWACNKQYFYQGEFVFEAKGANIYDPAQVIFTEAGEQLKGKRLKPVNVARMLKLNHDKLFLLESEAIEFIHETYEQYARARHTVQAAEANQLDFEALAQRAEKSTKKKMAIVKQDCDSFDIMPLEDAERDGKRVYQTTKVDRFLASYSGGKDSQVVLDLCTRAIPSTDFEVIYSDTGYELPPSLTLYDEIQKYYHAKYPDLKFSVARNHESVLNYWDKIGTPSDSHRWCCTIMKTAPLYKMLKVDDGKGGLRQAKVLTFDGVRAEESTRRSNYGRIGKGVKHETVINARPILNWSSCEIFLYLFEHKLPINQAYRMGMTRVGCVVCPFGSEWNEMVATNGFSHVCKPFLERIEKNAKKSGVKDVKDYVGQGGWKRRSSGDNISHTSFIEFKSSVPTFKAIINHPTIPINTFLYTIGAYSEHDSKGVVKGELKYRDTIIEYSITKKKDSYVFLIENISDIVLVGLIKRVLIKATYCINCEACEVECPTGALSVYPNVVINNTKCIHCHRCLEFKDKGCVVANSVYMTNGNITKQGQIDRYKNFGLKEEWLDEFLILRDNYWSSNHGLNENYQIPSLKNWLKDAEIIDSKNNITEIGNLLADIREDFPDVVWEITWINLVYNSFIVNWYANNVVKEIPFNARYLEGMISEQYPTYKEKTIHNAVYQVQRTLKESPIGFILGQLETLSNNNMVRHGHNELSIAAIAYSLYRYAQKKGTFSLKVSDLYEETAENGVFKEFAISKSALEKSLRTLNSMSNRIVVAELNMGLDSITLRQDITPIDALRIATQ